MSRRICALLLSAVVGLLVAGAISADEPGDASVTLRPGSNVVTWSGSEPYAIANFAGTPVRTVHRFDAVRQKWLGRAVGQSEATLPELHLLPRVQYLLVSGATHELMIPDPAADIDPLAALRFPPAPDDPLRFEAWWPNEDSPLEDLVVLRGEDERLSVEAWVAGGEGEIEAYWVLDGRVNHRGLASDDVELLPGKHDNARLFAVDESGRVAVARLPRVVKLPPLDRSATETRFGVVGHFNDGRNYSSIAEVEASAELIKAAGMSIVRKDLSVYLTESGRLVDFSPFGFDAILDVAHRNDLTILAIVGGSSPIWSSSLDKEHWGHWRGVSRHDPVSDQQLGRQIARRWPRQLLFEIGNEPNLSLYGGFVDPHAWAEHHKAMALGIWYENPRAIIVSAGICCYGWGDVIQYMPDSPYPGGGGWIYSDGIAFLEEAYDHGLGRFSDIIGVHPVPYTSQDNFRASQLLEQYIDVIDRRGDLDKPVWATELSTFLDEDSEKRGPYLVGELEFLSNHPRVRAAIIYNFRDKPPPTDTSVSGLVFGSYERGFTPKPEYWAVREFLTGKPPP